MIFHPGDCLWINYDDPATATVNERRYVYEIAAVPDAHLIPFSGQSAMVITPEQNAQPVVDLVKAASVNPLAPGEFRCAPLFVRRVFVADLERGYVEASQWLALNPGDPDATRLASCASAPALLVNPADFNDSKRADISRPCIRVATVDDVAFARKTHEMCIRWAIAYASENPYDWGAPRPANRPCMMDKPLALFDLFAADGQARRPSASVSTSTFGKSTAPFYRFIQPANPDGQRFWPLVTGATAANPKSYRISHQPPLDIWPEVHAELQRDYYNYSTYGSVHDEAGGNDAQRVWPLQHFHPSDRCRELVFWSAPWKNFEDAESAPSAPLDYSRYQIREEVNADNATKYYMNPSDGTAAFGHPEVNLMWDKDHLSVGSLGDQRTKIWSIFGTYGADRNLNGRFDYEGIPRSVVLRAEAVSRFTIYDPILPVHVEN